jgi:uncharacterized protein (TIGR00269 family)
MKCKICKDKAEIYLRSYNLALCREDFIHFFERKVKRSIEQWKMFTRKEKILVAVSGGKDSLGLLHLLGKLGYDVTGYYINLGIDGYSDVSQNKVKEFSRSSGIMILIEDVRVSWGTGIGDLAKKVRRPPCSLCGMVKRYLMNRAAVEFDAMATGHNQDDETATLLGNLLRWDKGYLARQSPVLKEKRGLKKRVKPLSFITERESAAYALMEGIDYIMEECPLAKGATSLFYKGILNQLEEKMPGTKSRFLKGFLEYQRNHPLIEEEEELVACKRCGSLTTSEVCNFCRLEDKIKS